MDNAIKQDPADFIFFVTQDQYDAEVRQARLKEARVDKRKEIVAKLSSSTEISPRRRSTMRTRSQVPRKEPNHVYGCALQIIKMILTRRPRDLRRSSTFLAQAEIVRKNRSFQDFFSRTTPRVTRFTSDRNRNKRYFAELDLMAVLRRIATAKHDDYFSSESFLRPVKRFLDNPLAEKILCLYKEETLARYAREDEMIVEYCTKPSSL